MIPPGGSRGSISVVVAEASPVFDPVFVPVSVPVSSESEVFVPVAVSLSDFPVSDAVSAVAVGLAFSVCVLESSSGEEAGR